MDSFDVAPAMAPRSDDQKDTAEAGAQSDAAPAGAAVPDRAAVMAALRACYDPCCRERGVSIVDMGLIQEVQVEAGRVSIAMLLTSGWYPFSTSPEQMIESAVKRLPGVDEVEVEMVWNPVWTPGRMSEEACRKLTLPMAQLLPPLSEPLQPQPGA
ncbi:MAG TPA: metal-sulfur cluster assembly factor [Ktedonobacterales bacterium]|nr:metal-sulfur cluster assembly factor [Ktedonobacterales bacterium]